MTKAELIDRLHEQAGEGVTKKTCGVLVDALFENVAATIRRDGRFAYPGFGTWIVRKRKARTGRNPQTGEALRIKASKTVGFRPAQALKEKL